LHNSHLHTVETSIQKQLSFHEKCESTNIHFKTGTHMCSEKTVDMFLFSIQDNK